MTSTLRGDRGTILLQVLMFMTLVTAVAVGVAILARMETYVSAHYRQRREMAAAAVAGAEVAIQDLRTAADWSQVLAGTRRATFADTGISAVPSRDGPARAICCGTASLTGALAAETGVSWTPFGWATLDALTGTSSSIPSHIVVWIADDEGDADGDPAADSNGVLRVHVEALALSGARRVVETTVERGTAPFPRILLWREW